MIIYNKLHGYSKNKDYIVGRGFVDSMSNIFNSLKSAAIPFLKSTGSYISTNKDLIAKPLLGALGSAAASGITVGTNSLLNYIKNRNNNTPTVDKLDAKGLEILNSILAAPMNENRLPTSNNKQTPTVDKLDAKGLEILNNILAAPTNENQIPTSNIIGSGVKKNVKSRKKKGSGIKMF